MVGFRLGIRNLKLMGVPFVECFFWVGSPKTRRKEGRQEPARPKNPKPKKATKKKTAMSM
jgi:hypothetical protein